MRKWQDFKQKKLNEINFPTAGGEGASVPPGPKPSHPELKQPGAPFNLDKTGGHDAPAAFGDPMVNAKIEIKKALDLTTKLLDTLEGLPQPYYDRFYGTAEQLYDLQADLSEVK